MSPSCLWESWVSKISWFQVRCGDISNLGSNNASNEQVTGIMRKTLKNEKMSLSREADLNHRPKDHWLNIQLQSSALPAELSRVDRLCIVKACANVRADYFFNYNFVIIPFVTTQSMWCVGNFFFKSPGMVVQVGFELATSGSIIRRHNHYTTRSSCKHRQNIRSYVIDKCRNLATLLSM